MKQDKLLSIVFLFILFGVLLFYPIKQVLISTGISTIYTDDNWVTYEKKEENNVIDKLENKFGSIKTSVENRVTNYFPLYKELNGIYQMSNYYLNSIVYDNIPLKTNSDGEYIFYNKQDNFYYLENKYTKEELDERLATQVKFFNNLSNKGIDVYIYIPTRYELTSLSTRNLSNYIDIFKSKLNGNIEVRSMEVSSIEEYKNYFYKTDHHWNINGALEGYYAIIDMLDKPGIKDIKTKTMTEKKYYGSLAKSILNDSINDYIMDVDLELEYDVIVNGKDKDELFKPRLIRTDRDYKYYDYYVSYFNGQYGNVIYDYHNPNSENLLILCDSNAWQIDYIIAASFNKTHVINLRYDEYKDNNFDIDKYMKENDISKVLFLYDGESILFDQFNYDFSRRVN